MAPMMIAYKERVEAGVSADPEAGKDWFICKASRRVRLLVFFFQCVLPCCLRRVLLGGFPSQWTIALTLMTLPAWCGGCASDCPQQGRSKAMPPLDLPLPAPLLAYPCQILREKGVKRPERNLRPCFSDFKTSQSSRKVCQRRWRAVSATTIRLLANLLIERDLFLTISSTSRRYYCSSLFSSSELPSQACTTNNILS